MNPTAFLRFDGYHTFDLALTVVKANGIPHVADFGKRTLEVPNEDFAWARDELSRAQLVADREYTVARPFNPLDFYK